MVVDLGRADVAGWGCELAAAPDERANLAVPEAAVRLGDPTGKYLPDRDTKGPDVGRGAELFVQSFRGSPPQRNLLVDPDVLGGVLLPGLDQARTHTEVGDLAVFHGVQHDVAGREVAVDDPAGGDILHPESDLRSIC